LHEILTTIEEDLGNVLFLIGGDLNARIKDFIDFIDDDNLDYVYNGDVAYPGDEFRLPRASSDSNYNTFGLSLIDLCCSKDVHVLNGRFSDVNVHITCTANGGSSVVDYLVASTGVWLKCESRAFPYKPMSLQQAPIKCE